MEHHPVDRRKFLRATASAAAGASLSLSAKSYGRVSGSLARLNIGFIGCGARAQAHIHLITRMSLDNRGVTPMAVCDVWDGHEEQYDHTFNGNTTRRNYSQGLYPSAKKTGLNPDDKKRVVKDYRRLLELKDIDVVCISTPNHWHVKQTLDSLAAGKDVYVERPLARSIVETTAIQAAVQRHQRILCVGVQQLVDPTWATIRELILTGQVGAISQVQAGVHRHDPRGQWRYYRILKAMNRKTIDWDLFSGRGFEVAGAPVQPDPMGFDPVRFAQWRCYREFHGGPIWDWLYPLTVKLLAATGLTNPDHVLSLTNQGIEQDGRTVADTVTILANYPSASQLILSATTASAGPTEELIRGQQGTIRIVKGGYEWLRGKETELRLLTQPKNETEELWTQFLDCVRRRDPQTPSALTVNGDAVSLLSQVPLTVTSTP